MTAKAHLQLPLELTHARAQDWLKSLIFAIHQESESQVTVDASRLSRFDSSALAVLLACRREALSAQKTFVVSHMPDQMRQLARVYGVSDLLQSADGSC
jgi:phospholipid transport system transporter-binding protein